MFRIGALERLRSTRASNTALIERASSFSACNVPDELQADWARLTAENSCWRAQCNVDFIHFLLMSSLRCSRAGSDSVGSDSVGADGDLVWSTYRRSDDFCVTALVTASWRSVCVAIVMMSLSSSFHVNFALFWRFANSCTCASVTPVVSKLRLRTEPVPSQLIILMVIDMSTFCFEWILVLIVLENEE